MGSICEVLQSIKEKIAELQGMVNKTVNIFLGIVCFSSILREEDSGMGEFIELDYRRSVTLESN